MKHKELNKYKNPKNKCRHCRIAHRCIPARANKKTLEQSKQLEFESYILEPGQYLYRQGELLEELFAIRAGVLKSITTLEDGREFVMGFHLPPDLFGWEAIDKNQLSVSVIAIDYSNVCRIPLKNLNSIVREIPEIEHQLLQLVSQRIQNDNLTLLRSSAEQRVANFILKLSKHYASLGYPLHLCKLTMTHQDIANYLRIAPETISRTFRQLQQKGIINVTRRDLYLNDIQKLKEIAEVESL